MNTQLFNEGGYNAVPRRIDAVAQAGSTGLLVVDREFPEGAFSGDLLNESARAEGARPVFILMLDFVTGPLWLSDQSVPELEDWAEGVGIASEVQEWGDIDDVASLELDGTPVLAGDFTTSVHIAGGAAGTSTLWTRLTDPLERPEQVTARLYLWFRDLDPEVDPPVVVWEGVVNEWAFRDEQTLFLRFNDGMQVRDKVVGRAITKENFPNAGINDYGKPEPIIYGRVEKVPCIPLNVGKIATLATTLQPGRTSVDGEDRPETKLPYLPLNPPDPFLEEFVPPKLHGEHYEFVYINDDEAGRSFPIAGSAFIDEEEVIWFSHNINPVDGIPFDLGKQEGVGIRWITLEPYDFILDTDFGVEHDGRAQNGTFAVGHDRGTPVVLKNSEYKYLVAGHPCKAVTRVYLMDSQGFPIALTTNSDNPAKDDYTINLNDTSFADGRARTTIRFTRPPTIKRQARSSSSSGFPANRTTEQQNALGSFPRQFPNVNAGVDFPALPPGYSFVRQTLTIQFDFGTWQSGIDTFQIGGVGARLVTGGGAPQTIQLTTEIDDDHLVVNPGVGNTITLGNVTRLVIALGPQQTEVIIAGVGELHVLADVEGYQDDASGTFTGTANALIVRARDVIKHFLVTEMDFEPGSLETSPDLVAKMGDLYKLQGRIAEPVKAKEVVSRLAFEAGCFIKFSGPRPRLVFRERTAAPTITLLDDDVVMVEQGRLTAERRVVPIDWIVNKIEARFKRDYAKPRAPDAYLSVVILQDAPSQNRFGIKERPELFFFDFIADEANARSVADLYLALQKVRREFVTVQLYLDRPTLLFGDRIGVNTRTTGLQVLEILSRDLRPYDGASRRMPEIRLTCLTLDLT